MPVYIPHSIAEATQMLLDTPTATLLNGGTDLMVEINFNHRKPTDVISLRHVHELRTWSFDEVNQKVFIGSGVPYAEIENGILKTLSPALAAASRTVGSPQIRAAGTIGGNLGTCSPAGDTLPVLAALDAEIQLASSSEVRSVSFAEFMVGPKRNSKRSDEIIIGVTIPASNGWQGYSKVGVRNAMVISVASACLAVQNGTLRIALGSVGPTIIRCTETENWMNENFDISAGLSDSVVDEFSRRIANEARPIDDHRSTAEYRRHAISVLAKRLLLRSTQS
jgi:CO/xanthine dehydrogenase FAD-binding subunit